MKKFIAGLVTGVLISFVPMTLALSTLFSDVPENQWYTNAVLSLNEKGIIQGYPNGTFGPNDSVNRAELAVMLDRTLKYLEGENLEGKTFQGSGFVFNYPSEYLADEKGLWTKEGYDLHLNPPQNCSTCQIPFIEVKSEKTTQALESYIIQDFELPGSTLAEMSEMTGIEYSQQTIGGNNFIKLTVSDLQDVTAYYTQREDQILTFKVYATEQDNTQLHDLLSTLQFS